MAKITSCGVADCAYHGKDRCHASVIQVRGDRPRCDTFHESPLKSLGSGNHGDVEVCRAAECRFNSLFECQAGEIRIERYPDHPYPSCATYLSR